MTEVPVCESLRCVFFSSFFFFFFLDHLLSCFVVLNIAAATLTFALTSASLSHVANLSRLLLRVLLDQVRSKNGKAFLYSATTFQITNTSHLTSLPTRTEDKPNFLARNANLPCLKQRITTF